MTTTSRTFNQQQADETRKSPQQDGDGDIVMVTPRALAGPGEPSTVISQLADSGWTLICDPAANAHMLSPDGRLYLGFLPEMNGPLWTVQAVREKGDITSVWDATFSDETPPEAVAAFITELTRAGGYPREREDLSDPSHRPSATTR